jgi:hypothetical protein
MTVYELAETREYDRIEKGYPWNGYQVWHVWRSRQEGARLGQPKYILKNEDGVRFATLDELKEIRHKQQTHGGETY